ncbi:MAG: hypothetical protein DI586_06810 [Micavibrio aeruginosavorus]|uniref:Prepilin-type N-terminal cleavage/methylation domain-containing protein n=1 Tax=Micavibrio aeruginosavorus TaxID=349221 RepID=A0A2W5HIH2_9BACT|nr:MAG: hypothetical protein DI586_06810 [Micavibrio aeruginosavorus]
MRNNTGFTLVELSIVMIIIGLLIGGVLKGQELISNARIATLVSQAKQVSAAYNTFYDSYRAVPGDMATATALVPDCSVATACANGNGDNLLGVGLPNNMYAEAWSDVAAQINSENTQFWKHLALADLIGGLNSGATVVAWEKTHPYSPLDAGFHARSSRAFGNIGTLNGLTMVLRNDIGGRWLCDITPDNCAISPAYAFLIDKRMDDGFATSGIIQAISTNGWANGCGRANRGPNGPDGYAHDKTTKSCDMMFKIEN